MIKFTRLFLLLLLTACQTTGSNQAATKQQFEINYPESPVLQLRSTRPEFIGRYFTPNPTQLDGHIDFMTEMGSSFDDLFKAWLYQRFEFEWQESAHLNIRIQQAELAKMKMNDDDKYKLKVNGSFEFTDVKGYLSLAIPFALRERVLIAQNATMSERQDKLQQMMVSAMQDLDQQVREQWSKILQDAELLNETQKTENGES